VVGSKSPFLDGFPRSPSIETGIRHLMSHEYFFPGTPFLVLISPPPQVTSSPGRRRLHLLTFFRIRGKRFGTVGCRPSFCMAQFCRISVIQFHFFPPLYFTSPCHALFSRNHTSSLHMPSPPAPDEHGAFLCPKPVFEVRAVPQLVFFAFPKFSCEKVGLLTSKRPPLVPSC